MDHDVAVAAFIIGAGNFYRTFLRHKKDLFTSDGSFVKLIVDIPIQFANICCRAGLQLQRLGVSFIDVILAAVKW